MADNNKRPDEKKQQQPILKAGSGSIGQKGNSQVTKEQKAKASSQESNDKTIVEVKPDQRMLLVHLSILAQEDAISDGDGHLLPDKKRNLWVQLGRWVKYEEKVEQDAERLGIPQIPMITFESVQGFRNLFAKNGYLLTVDGPDTSVDEVMNLIVDSLQSAQALSNVSSKEDRANFIETVLLASHVLKPRQSGVKRSTGSLNKLNSFGDGVIRNLRRGSIMVGLTSSEEASVKTTSSSHSFSNDLNVEILLYRPTGLVPPKAENEQSQFISNIRRDSVSSKYGKPRASIISMENMKWLDPVDAAGKSADGQQSEIGLVLVGENSGIRQDSVLFVQLSDPILMPELVDVKVPVRFLCFVLAPPSSIPIVRQKELGRAISTLLANQDFQSRMHTAKTKQQVLQEVDHFLDYCIIIPPGKWDPDRFPFDRLKSLFKPVSKAPEARRKVSAPPISVSSPQSICELDELKLKDGVLGHDHAFEKDSDQASLRRTGKFFGGLRAEFGKRFPMYLSDLKDGLNLQCLATIIFVYFACVSGNIAFGGLMGAKTENYIGISETLMSAAVGGTIYSLFSAQPLLIVGTTGPVLVFDESLFKLCKSYDLSGNEFLIIRVWIGIWLGFIALIFTSFDGTYILKFFTRFTQEIFATLISFVFIVESMKSLLKIYKQHPILEFYEYQINGSLLTDHVSDEVLGQPNIALLSTILMFGTYFIATSLKDFRNSGFFNSMIRNVIANFAVLFSIIGMGLLDWYVSQTDTPKLHLPDASDGLKNSQENRTAWFIYPFQPFEGGPVPFWMIPLLTCVPALLLFIFVFMETGISELIVEKKESKLKKGSGFHLNVLLMCLVNTVMGLFGLGWVSAPTIRSMAHFNALTLYSTSNVPGEKQEPVGVLEQRVTGFFVSLIIGVSVLMADVLVYIPLAVLFGIFLFMGVTSLNGVQFVDRALLLLKPVEVHPQVPYVLNVRRWKMNVFTIVQLGVLAVLWAIKESPASLFLALLTLLLVPLRFFVLKLWFSSSELAALDGS